MRKRLIIILTLCLIGIGANAATKAQFMGIDLDVSAKVFEQRLVAKGFTLIDEDPDGNMYEGKFTGKDVTVVLEPSADGLIDLVGVYLPAQKDWNSLIKEFNLYVDQYTAKYGEPFIELEDYNGLKPGTPQFVEAISDGLLTKRTIYSVDEWLISLTVQSKITDESGDYQLLILYISDREEEIDYSDDI